MTFVEVLGVAAIGTLMLGAMSTIFVFSNRSFAVLGSYADLNDENRVVLAQITRDVRQADSLANMINNKENGSDRKLILNSAGGQIEYRYKPGEKKLYRIASGRSVEMMTGVDDFDMLIYQRNPVPGSYDYFPAASTNTCKLIQLNWTVSRTVLGRTAASQTSRSAKIVIRKG